jgi:protein phosphatase
LTAHLADAEIASMLGSDDPQMACDDLLALTLRRGASDNVSLIVVDSLAEDGCRVRTARRKQ